MEELSILEETHETLQSWANDEGLELWEVVRRVVEEHRLRELGRIELKKGETIKAFAGSGKAFLIIQNVDGDVFTRTDANREEIKDGR